MTDDLHPIWVDTPDGVAAAAETAAEVGGLALDTEADSLHSYYHKVCLIQLTADGANFVIDPLALDAAELEPLWRLVGDPTVPVLMHGADYDIRVLDRDYGVGIRGLVDTQIMAQVLGEPKTGLAALLDQELGVTLDKRHQRADWGRRPLTGSQIAYAAADTAHLDALANRLGRRLDDLGRRRWAEEEFRRLEQVRYRPVEPDPLAFERVKGVRALRGADRDRAFTLFEWREAEAQRLDLPPFKVLGNRALLALASNPPAELSELALVDGIGPRFTRRWGKPVLRALGSPRRAPQWQRAQRRPDEPPAVVRRMKRLAAARDAVAAELAIEPGLLCSKASLIELAKIDPADASTDVLESAGLRGWRLEVLAEPLLEVIARTIHE